MAGAYLLSVVVYVGAINVAAFAMFGWDKHCARTGRWRVRESTLLTIAALGGIIGAVAAQHGLRHKTRKEPFCTQLYLIAGAQVVALIAISIPAVRGVVLSAIS